MYHPRIVHLCNVKEVAPSKRLNSKALIYLFYLFLSWFHNNWPSIIRKDVKTIWTILNVIHDYAKVPTSSDHIAENIARKDLKFRPEIQRDVFLNGIFF